MDAMHDALNDALFADGPHFVPIPDLRSHEPPRDSGDETSDQQDELRAERRAGLRDERLMP
jgi:hypothetical protein